MENREGLLVTKAFKFYVVENGRRVVKSFRPGQFLPRQDWDREASPRSKRSMVNAEFVKESLPLTVGSGATVINTTPTQTAPKRRGRPPKQKG